MAKLCSALYGERNGVLSLLCLALRSGHVRSRWVYSMDQADWNPPMLWVKEIFSCDAKPPP